MSLRRAAVTFLAVAAIFCTPLAAQQKVGIINMEEAIARTQEGQRLMAEFQERYAPRQQELEDLQKEIQDLQAQLSAGANTLSDDARRDISFRIEQRQTQGQRLLEDARGELAQEQNRIFTEVGNKVVAVIDKYAAENGFGVVLNVSAQPSLVLFALNELNITQAIIEAYDAQNGGAPAPGE